MTRGALFSTGFLFLTLSVAPRAALGQSDAEVERARAAFAEGVELSDQERWSEAADRFREVMEVRATAQVKYNLAVALEHDGQLAEAVVLLRDVAGDRDLDRATRREAQRLLESTERRVGTLTVHVSGDVAGATIEVNGREIAADQLGIPLPADPGDNTVVLSRGGRQVDRQSASVPEGGSASVTLNAASVPTPAEVALEVEVPPEEPEEPDEPTDYGVLGEWWFWTAIAGVVVGAVLIGIVVSSGGDEDPVRGNLNPPIIEVMP